MSRKAGVVSFGDDVRAARVTKMKKMWSKRRRSWRNEQKKGQGKCISEKNKLMMRTLGKKRRKENKEEVLRK